MNNFIINYKNGHSDSIISCDFINDNDNNIFATNSEDSTLRVWDLRLKNCPKFFKNKEINKNMTNLIFNNNYIYVGCEKELFIFDIRNDKIIENNYFAKKNIDIEEFTILKLSNNRDYIFFTDDNGSLGRISTLKDDIKIIYDKNKLLNISWGLCPIQENNNYSIFIGGYDEIVSKFKFDNNLKSYNTKINSSDANSEDKNITKIINENFELKNRYFIMDYYINFPEILIKNIKPFILDMEYNDISKDIIISLENGNLISIKSKQPKKARFIIQGHNHRIIKSEYAKFNNDFIITCSDDLSIGIWNSKNQKLIEKLKIPAKPNFFRSVKNNKIILCDINKELKILELK